MNNQSLESIVKQRLVKNVCIFFRWVYLKHLKKKQILKLKYLGTVLLAIYVSWCVLAGAPRVGISRILDVSFSGHALMVSTVCITKSYMCVLLHIKVYLAKKKKKKHFYLF